jgi:hypothetical protein
VLITYSPTSLESITTRGVLSDGTHYSCDGALSDDIVGREASSEVFGEDAEVVRGGDKVGRYWVKARLEEGVYLGCYAEGWEVENKILRVVRQ